MSAAVTAVNAKSFINSPSYQQGYQTGAKDGYRVGYDAGNQVCIKDGKNSIITKIPNPIEQAGMSKLYNAGYNAGFKANYIIGYHNARYKCLQK